MELPEEEFHKNPVKRTGRSSWCKACTKIYDAEYYRKNRIKIIENKKDYYKEGSSRPRGSGTKYRVGLAREEYDYMFESQGGLCAICGKKPGIKGLAIDHCHKTGEIRGLLCGRCNTALGSFRDDPEILRSAILYLGAEG
jgi:hypothetical protein